MTLTPMPVIERTQILLPADTIGMTDSWIAHSALYLCTPGGNPETIQAAVEASFRRAGYLEVKVTKQNLSAAARCHPDHYWSNDEHTYWFTLLGGPRWQVTRCPRCEWEERRAKSLPAVPSE